MTIVDRRGLTVDGTPSAASATDPSAHLAIKAPVRVASTADIALSGLQSVDGIVLAENDRVLIRSQSDPSENGIYRVSSGNWTRAVDFDGPNDAVRGTQVWIVEGAANGGRWAHLTAAGPIIPGDSALTFSLIAEEGSFTPTLTFATPGDINVVYAVRVGAFIKIGNLVVAQFSLVTSAFTHSTASGNVRITGFPYPARSLNGNAQRASGVQWQGITKASHTDMMVALEPGQTEATVRGSGSGQASVNIVAGDMPSGGQVVLRGCLPYFV